MPTDRDSPIGFTNAGYRIADTSSVLRTRWCAGTATPREASASCVRYLSIISLIVWLFDPMYGMPRPSRTSATHMAFSPRPMNFSFGVM